MTQPISTATAYHRATSYTRHGMTPHTLDWAHQPQPTKNYPQLDRMPMVRNLALPAINYSDLVESALTGDRQPTAALDINNLSALFYLTHTVTARSMHGGQPFYYRSVASAGALYPFEMYLAVHHIDGMSPGVYHYDLFDVSLNVLRGDTVPVIPPSPHGVAATVYISGIFFRSAWKYRSRAYRYVLLDAGHLLENLRLALNALGLSHSIHLDFDDENVATLLGLDTRREVCLACIHLADSVTGTAPVAARGELAPLSTEIVQASRVSMKEVAYQEIVQAHCAGYGESGTREDRLAVMDAMGRSPQTWQSVMSPDRPNTPEYVEVLRRRRSRRNFIPTPLSGDRLTAFLGLIANAAAADLPCSQPAIINTGLLMGTGMPVSPGCYLYDHRDRRLGRLSAGNFMEPMAAACLDQMWLKNAGLHLLFMTDLAALDRARGARGYRSAMIEAGRLGQQTYLAATALGIGACGIGAIYDREAADLLDLGGDGALLYLVGVGPVKSA